MADWAILRESAEMLGAVAIGWWVARRAPDGVEWGAWVKAKRKLTRFRRAFS